MTWSRAAAVQDRMQFISIRPDAAVALLWQNLCLDHVP
jgi:hypothetical protein